MTTERKRDGYDDDDDVVSASDAKEVLRHEKVRVSPTIRVNYMLEGSIGGNECDLLATAGV